ncbi:MAG TPA: phospholipid carrier-dependent glycosyltransferase, partial [Bacilli bacterium]
SFIEQYWIPRFDPVLLLTSFANLILLMYIIKVGWDMFITKVPQLQLIEPINALSRKLEDPKSLLIEEQAYQMEKIEQQQMNPDQPANEQEKLGRKDYGLLIGLIVVYTIVALINLGSFKAPESLWKPANGGEGLYVDFGESKQLQRMSSFGGPGNGKYKIEFSDDASTWSGQQSIEREVGNVFKWVSTDLSVTARYVRVSAETPGFRLNELAFYEMNNSGTPLPISTIVPDENISELTEGKAENLFDEQREAAYTPTYLNGTYFDEIYHARTAYEQLHGIEAYESTHPPLGKIIIGWGTAIFGMNPFGWRIAGTLFGIAMIPLMYIFARRLFRKPEYAFISAFLLSFDFMHFVQTRIATIDVYGVFFIMLMFYYMYRYYRTSFYYHSLNRTLILLGLSGLFFGIGVASKWISLYAGAGLAVIFFISLFERYSQYRKAKNRHFNKNSKLSKEIQSHDAHIMAVFPKYTLATLASCLLFFILIPAVIYTMSYIPYLNVKGVKHDLKDIVVYQKNMYDYHKNLVATHPFSSNWAEWPIIARPVWYYGGAAPEGKISSIAAMGNPAIWWVGIAGILGALYLGYRKRDRNILFLFVAMCSLYVPWMLVTRLTFIYHFFAMVPFMIFCIVYVMKHFKEQALPYVKSLIYSYMALVFLLFVMFYPILSGAVVYRRYGDVFLRWFSSWVIF